VLRIIFAEKGAEGLVQKFSGGCLRSNFPWNEQRLPYLDSEGKLSSRKGVVNKHDFGS